MGVVCDCGAICYYTGVKRQSLKDYSSIIEEVYEFRCAVCQELARILIRRERYR